MIELDPRKVVEAVRVGGWRMEHDVSYFSMFMGSPILINNRWIGYYEVEDLNIFNSSLHDGCPIDQSAFQSIADFVGEKQFDAVDFWGCSLPENLDLQGYDRSSWQDDLSNVPTQVNMSVFNLSLSKRQKEVRRGKKHGLVAKQVAVDYLSSQQIGMLYDFMEAHELPGPDISFVTHADSFVRRAEAVVFDVLTSDARLCGFGIASKALSRSLIVHHLFHDGTKYVSDVFYDAVFRYAQESEFQLVDIGYSIQERLKAFKTDLGANVFLPPNNGVRFIRASKAPRPVHWVLRTLENYVGI